LSSSEWPRAERNCALAVLFEAQVNRGEKAVEVSDVVDDEPALLGIAAAPLARPVEAALCRIVERGALEAAVVSGFQPAESVHRLEIAGPLLVSIDADRKVTSIPVDGEDRSGLRVGVC